MCTCPVRAYVIVRACVLHMHRSSGSSNDPGLVQRGGERNVPRPEPLPVVELARSPHVLAGSPGYPGSSHPAEGRAGGLGVSAPAPLGECSWERPGRDRRPVRGGCPPRPRAAQRGSGPPRTGTMGWKIIVVCVCFVCLFSFLQRSEDFSSGGMAHPKPAQP